MRKVHTLILDAYTSGKAQYKNKAHRFLRTGNVSEFIHYDQTIIKIDLDKQELTITDYNSSSTAEAINSYLGVLKALGHLNGLEIIDYSDKQYGYLYGLCDVKSELEKHKYFFEKDTMDRVFSYFKRTVNQYGLEKLNHEAKPKFPDDIDFEPYLDMILSRIGDEKHVAKPYHKNLIKKFIYFTNHLSPIDGDRIKKLSAHPEAGNKLKDVIAELSLKGELN